MALRNKINKVLIANRGEIALRIKRACRKLGIRSAAIVSEADKNSLFAREAEELYVIGPAPARESYLAADKIIAAAKELGCDAIHPGYGFLSENAEFARKVIDNGLVFVGPSPESIEALGSKTKARAHVKRFGVPVTPGSEGGLSDQRLVELAAQIGFPVIVKAVAGGGGRGMRIVNSAGELTQILPRARAEALKNFASDDVYLEKFIEQPRHVEVQILGDAFGHVIHLGTRDCSTQRRHQKLVEEAPAPNLSSDLRERIHMAAVNAAKSVSYQNAGTAEFLVKGEEFYFLEMNTRIQVEHPATEMVTGVDLVELQLKVAQGERIPWSQDQITFDGHAIEFRIYAEDPANNFAPSPGRITRLKRNDAPYVREDIGFSEGDEISLHYDAMISKLIVKGENRSDAIAKSIAILRSYVVEGVISCVDLDLWLLYNNNFRRAPLDISFIEREFSPSCIRQVRASLVRDPLHVAPIGGAEVKNIYNYKSKKFNRTYTIEVIHKPDGFFMAVPVDTASGKRGKNTYCRLSNGFDAAMKSLISDVLEKTPPSEMFAE